MEEDIVNLVQEVLGVPLTVDSHMGDPEEWDSLATVNIVLALEEAYEIFIPVSDYRSLQRLEYLVTYVEVRCTL